MACFPLAANSVQYRAMGASRSSSPASTRTGRYATPAWPLYRRLARDLRDGALEVANREGRTAEATWGPTPKSARLLRIDHAFVHGLEVDRFRVLPIPGSDHSGILMECRLSPFASSSRER